MFLTQIRGIIKSNEKEARLTISSEINTAWNYLLLGALIILLIVSIWHATKLFPLILIVIAQYTFLTFSAYNDLGKFEPIFIELIESAKIEKSI